MLQPDLSLIREYTLEDCTNRMRPPVCVTQFKQAGYELLYVNADHVQGIDNPTCQTIRNAFDLFQPKAVVVETVSGGGQVGDAYWRFVLDAAANGFTRASECQYSVFLAKEKGLPVFGGEPSDRQQLLAFVGGGYSVKDSIAYFTLQYTGQQSRRGYLTEEYFKNEAAQHLDWLAMNVGIASKDGLSVDEYKTWFATHYPNRKTCLDCHSDDTVPSRVADASIGQKMAFLQDCAREPHIVNVITKVLNQFETVLVVYGSGHRETQYGVLEKMLGTGRMYFLSQNRLQRIGSAKL